MERELKLEIRQIHMSLDSQCVLNWIGSKRTFTTFIENRLIEIRKDREINFHYIASLENPADLASRGLGTEELRDNGRWWYGPEWLLSPNDRWPAWKLNNNGNDNIDNDNIDNDIMAHKESEMTTKKTMYEAKLVAGEGCRNQQDVSTKVSAPLNIEIHRFSSLAKLLRVTALALKFVNKFKKTARSNDRLDSEEIIQAETLWTRYIQRLHYSDIIDAIHKNKHNNIKEQLGIYLDSENI